MAQYDPKLASEPVSKVLYNIGATNTQISAFEEYHAWHQAAENVLFIDSQRRVVSQVPWIDDTLIVSFHYVPMGYFASPLRQLEEHEKWEELTEGDNVLLCGHYLLVVEPSEQTFTPAPTATESVTVMKLATMQAPTQHDPIRGDPMPRQLRPGFRADQREAMGERQGQNGYHHQGQGGIYRREVPVAPPRPQPVKLEQVINWLKVTGVEAVPGSRRGKNRLQGAPLVRTAIC